MSWTVQNIVDRLVPNATNMQPLSAPCYTGTNPKGVGLAVETMRRHMSDEGWQLFAGLEHAGYTLAGARLPVDNTHVPTILKRTGAGVVVVQDKREWDPQLRGFNNPADEFKQVQQLAERDDLFRVTVVKDSHHMPVYHRRSAEEIGCHAWIIYYHPRIVCHLAPYLRPEHCIRVYHTVDKYQVPKRLTNNEGCLLSGAMSGHYPLRNLLLQRLSWLPNTRYMKHPGYGATGSATPQYLSKLSKFKVAICTSSRYGYALRRLIEATACGCRVLTDLPEDEIVPYIDNNFVRICYTTPIPIIANKLRWMMDTYDRDRQHYFSEQAKQYFDYRISGLRLASEIEYVRQNYELSSIASG